MSYPKIIQPLVIEDDQKFKEHYEVVFGQLQKTHKIAPPRWAFCFNDGHQALLEERIYQLVIVDLRLPQKPGQPPAESVDFGLSLINECTSRNEYPIPAVLVITAHLSQTRQQELEAQVRASFAYGRVIAKAENLENEIELALQAVESYGDVGIHVRDGGERLFPTLTPREEDLLRRCVMADKQRTGLDLMWWASDFDPTAGWTKVLMGRFLLDEGHGHSLYTFFKLGNSDGSDHVFSVAEVMAQKLKHVKLIHRQAAGNRSLLVTQSAGSGKHAPLSLDDVLSRPTSQIAAHLPQISSSIAEQIAALGDRTPDQKEIRQLLWEFHESTRIETQWVKRGGQDVLDTYGDSVDCPVALFAQLSADVTLMRHDVQSMLHGDLNYTNIAIDEDGDSIQAFIFDASGSNAGPCIRDYAMLEITALLHQDVDESVISGCTALFRLDWEAAVPPEGVSDRQINTFVFVQSLRKAALNFASIDLYALALIDQALVQLGGLNFGSAFNKIRNPQDACLLAALVARWRRLLEPVPSHVEESMVE